MGRFEGKLGRFEENAYWGGLKGMCVWWFEGYACWMGGGFKSSALTYLLTDRMKRNQMSMYISAFRY